MKIFVFMGGSSSEKNVSVKTGNAVIDSLSKKYPNIRPVNISFRDMQFNFLDDISKGDIVFNALHGGSGENGDIQTILEMSQILYTGSDSKASRVCMDKHLSKMIAKSEGLTVPNWILCRNKNLSKTKLFNTAGKKFSYPYIVKPNNEGSTMGLTKVRNVDELDPAISQALEFSDEVMVEEYIEGREITVGVLGNRALPIVEIFPQNDFFDYECKYSKGMSNYEVPANIDSNVAAKIQEDALKIHESIGCRHYSRVDFILDEDDNYYFLEINSLPGMTSTSLLPMAACNVGLDFDRLIDIILNMAIIGDD